MTQKISMCFYSFFNQVIYHQSQPHGQLPTYYAFEGSTPSLHNYKANITLIE